MKTLELEMKLKNMDRVALGAICGLAFEVFDALVMIPLKYENNRKRNEATSAPSAIIARAYAPIIGTGIAGSVIIGFAVKAV